MFFVTYHGGGDFNNIYAYDQNGTQLSSAVLQVKQAKDISELRGITFYQGYLYVANGSKRMNTILCCSGSGISYTVIGSFVTGQTVNSISHPFAMAFDPDGSFYIAVRTKDQIWKYAQADFSNPALWLSCVAGSAPEFIVYAGADPE